MRTLLPDPGADRVAGVKAAETPLGNPLSVKATAALKPPLTATVTVMPLLDPAATESELADNAA